MVSIEVAIPVLLFIVSAAAAALGMLVMGRLLGPRRDNPVKRMPYESGMDPIHDTRRRFDVRFHLVAIAFLVFDVEVLFLYPWAVAARRADTAQAARGLDAAVAAGWIEGRVLVLGGVLLFIALMALGLVYDWRKGVFRWR